MFTKWEKVALVIVGIEMAFILSIPWAVNRHVQRTLKEEGYDTIEDYIAMRSRKQALRLVK